MECMVHRLDLGLHSYPKVLGNGVRTHVNCKRKTPSTGGSEGDGRLGMVVGGGGGERRERGRGGGGEEVEHATLHNAGQRVQHTTD